MVRRSNCLADMKGVLYRYDKFKRISVYVRACLIEEIGFGRRQTSEEDFGSRRFTIIDTRHPFFATQPSNSLCSPPLANRTIY
jgi:hypothetical protein